MGQGSRSWYAEATPPESARRARSYRAREPCVRSSRRRCSRSVSSAIRARSRVVAARVLTRASSHGGTVRAMATMADLAELALALPQATKEVSDDGRPEYLVHGKTFCFHRGRRRDAVDPETGERLDDVLMFRVADLGVKELLLADERGVYFTTPHFDGYPAVLMRIPDLARIDRDELEEMVVEAWLTRAQKRVAKAWLAEKGVESPTGQGGRA